MRNRTWSGILSLAALCLLVVSCAKRPSPEVYQRSYEFVKDSAERNLAERDYGKTYLLASILMDANPLDDEAFALKRDALVGDPTLDRLDRKEIWGWNVPYRKSSHAGPLKKLVLWPVNLFTDLFDVVTVEVGLGLGVGAKAQVTEPLSAGAQLSLGQTMFGLKGRNPAVRASFENYLDILMFEIRALSESSFGTFGAYALAHDGTGVKNPDDRTYNRARDYYAIGAEVLAGVGANVEVHPIQIYDLLVGIVFFDPLTDNVGWTKSIGDLDEDEKEAVKRLINH